MSPRSRRPVRPRPAILRVGAFALACLWAWLAAYQNYLSIHLLAKPHFDGGMLVGGAHGDLGERSESERRRRLAHAHGLPHSHDQEHDHSHDHGHSGAHAHAHSHPHDGAGGHGHGHDHAPHAAADHMAFAALLSIAPSAPPSLAPPPPTAPPPFPFLRLIAQETPRANLQRGPPISV